MKALDSGRAKLGDRSLFPSLAARVYTHHAAIAPVSLPVREAVDQALQRYAERGAGAFSEYLEQRARLRGKLERLIGAEPGSVALEANTTRGVSDIALCLPWQTADRVLLLKGEFPANVIPWQRAAELFGLSLVWHDTATFREQPEQALQALESELQKGLRLIAVSAVQFQTGHCMPLAALGLLCEKYGAELFVDAIQGCGSVPLDVQQMRIDYLACGGHKWLMGMEGCGFLYVAPKRAPSLRPYVAGWVSHEDPEDFLVHGAGFFRYDKPFKRSALLFETGTQSLLGAVALEAGIDLLWELTVPVIYSHLQSYLDALEQELLARGFSSLRVREAAGRSGILSVLPPAGVDALKLHRALLAHGVVCGLPDGILRFSPHWPNHPSEVPVIAQAVDACLHDCAR